MEPSILPLFPGLPGGPELLIIFIVGVVLPFLLAWWVYKDAESRGNDNAALWALAVGLLTLFTFFGGLLALVVYVWQRD